MADSTLLSDDELSVLADEGDQSDLDKLQPDELHRLSRILETRQNPVAARRKARLEDTPQDQFPTSQGTTTGGEGFVAGLKREYADIPRAIGENTLGQRLIGGGLIDEMGLAEPLQKIEAMAVKTLGNRDWGAYGKPEAPPIKDPQQERDAKAEITGILAMKMRAAGIAQALPTIAGHLISAPFKSAAESITAPSTQLRERPEEMVMNLIAAGGLAKGVKGILAGAERKVLSESPEVAAAAMTKADDIVESADEAAAAARQAGDATEAELSKQVADRAEALKEQLGIKEAPRIEAEVQAIKSEAANPERDLGSEFVRTANKSVSDIRSRVSNVRYGPLVEGEPETILFELDGKPYSGKLTGRNADLVVGAGSEQDAAIATRVLLDRQAKPIGEAGFARREPLVYIGGGAAGAALGGLIGSQIKDKYGENYAGTGMLLGPVIALGGLKYAIDPKFQEAADALMQIRGGRGKAGDFEDLARSIIEPMLSDQPVNLGGGIAIGAPVAGAIGGGVIGGYSGGTGDFSPGRAAIGAVGGAALGALHGQSLESAFGMVNPREAYRQWFTEGKGLPKEVQAARAAMLNRQAGRITEIMALVRKANKFDQETKNAIEEVVRGNLSPHELAPEARAVAADLRNTYDNLSLDLVESGIVGPKAAETILTNIGTYVPRLYLHHEQGDALAKVAAYLKSNGMRMSDMSYLRKRKDLPADIRAALGEISSEFGRANPAYLLGKRAPVVAADVEFANYAKFIASSPDYTLPAALAPESGSTGGLITASNGKRYLKLGDSRRLGVLKGQWVEESIGRDLQTFTEVPSALRRIMDTGTGIFKASKIGLNPATLMRNIYGNLVTADQGGLSPARLDIYDRSAMDVWKKRPRYHEASLGGLFGGEWFGQEVNGLIKASPESKTFAGKSLNWFADNAHAPLEKISKMHGATEQVTKMALYNYARDEMGMAPEQAVAYAKRYGFDYRDVPRWIQVTRKSPLGAPFISFSYKALPRVFENAVSVGTAGDPFGKFWRFWKWPLALGAVNEYSARNINMIDPQERGFLPTVKRLANEAIIGATGMGQSFGRFGQLKGVLPDYIGSQQMLMPHRDQFNRPGLLDLTWTLPWGDVGESGTGTLGKQLAKAGIPFPRVLEPTNPWFQSFAAIYGGTDPFTGREIVQRNTTPAEAQAQWANYMMRLWGPSWMPGGFAFDKVSRAVQGDYQQDPMQPTIAQALRSEVLGIKIRNVDPRLAFGAKAERFKREIDDDKRALGQLRRAGASPERMNEINDRIRRKIERFRQQFGQIQDYPPTDPALIEARKRQ